MWGEERQAKLVRAQALRAERRRGEAGAGEESGLGALRRLEVAEAAAKDAEGALQRLLRERAAGNPPMRQQHSYGVPQAHESPARQTPIWLEGDDAPAPAPAAAPRSYLSRPEWDSGVTDRGGLELSPARGEPAGAPLGRRAPPPLSCRAAAPAGGASPERSRAGTGRLGSSLARLKSRSGSRSGRCRAPLGGGNALAPEEEDVFAPRRPARPAPAPGQAALPQWLQAERDEQVVPSRSPPPSTFSVPAGAAPPREQGPENGMDGVPEYSAPEQQQQCRGCGRTFNLKAYARHAKICKKVFQDKRKEFNSQLARAEGSEVVGGGSATAIYRGSRGRGAVRNGRAGGVASSGRSNSSTTGKSAPSSFAKSVNWKSKSEHFRAAMRAARNPGAPAAPAGPDPSLTPCPHCGRRFNEKAAERHIPKCQSIKAQPKMLRRGQGRAGGVGGRASAMNRSSGMW